MRRTLLLLVWMPTVGTTGCVAQQLAGVEQAEAAYERCVAERGEADPECDVLEEKKKVEQRRYEGDAKRRWGCDPLREDCPAVR